MSHYARLKVTEDAPVEVIRAAYRVLAAKYHPDRQTQTDEDISVAHGEMSALNTAYKVLINAQTRQEYDRLLAARRALSKGKVKGGAKKEDLEEMVIRVMPAEPSVTKVDLEWLPPKLDEKPQLWNQSRRTLFLGGSAAGVVLVGSVYWASQLFVQHQMERALSEQYAARPAVPVLTPTVPAIPVVLPAVPAPTNRSREVAATGDTAPSRAAVPVTDLTQLSNEELAKALPELKGGSFNSQTQAQRPARP